MHYAARQPILNLHGKVHGYELLFRNGPEAAFRGDGDFAMRNMLDSAMLFGLEKLTSNLPAFIKCTAETLTSGLVQIFPAKITVLEIREGIEPSPKLISACSSLRAAGYKLALDHFTWRRGIEALMEAAAYIKVDFSRTDAARAPPAAAPADGRAGGAGGRKGGNTRTVRESVRRRIFPGARLLLLPAGPA